MIEVKGHFHHSPRSGEDRNLKSLFDYFVEWLRDCNGKHGEDLSVGFVPDL